MAAYLNVADTTIYALVKGRRGWGSIEPIPHTAKLRSDGEVSQRARLVFERAAVDAWVARTGFVRQNNRRTPDRVAVEGDIF